MEIYNCKVLVGGSRSNEVRKEAIPAAEIVLLRHIHGDDSVIDLAHVGTSDMSDAEVRDLLALTYGPGDVDTTRAGPAILREVFGPPAMPLPRSVEGVEPVSATPKKIKPEKIRRLRDIRPEDQPAPIPAPMNAVAGAEMFDE
jgi:hypothetical protein